MLELAFEQVDEAKLVDRLREDAALYSASVAISDERVIAYAALSEARLNEDRVLVLAPVAVVPEHQGIGVGRLVTRHVLAKGGELPVSVLGDPSYYSRFGFSPADEYGIEAPFAVVPGALQVLNAEGLRAGVLEYAKAFGTH